MSNTNSLKALIKNIADAIRNRTSKSASMTIEEMPNEIASIQGPYPTQSKTVDVKKNGELIVEPDEGYVLDKVTANVDVVAVSDNNAKIVVDSTTSLIQNTSMLNSAIVTLDVSNWDTSNIKNMCYLFNECRKLTTLDVSNFNTSKATNMNYMFTNCRELTTLDVGNFNTSNVTNMAYMFEGCKKLTTLDVSNWDTSNVTSMYSMFDGEWVDGMALTTLDVSNWDTSKVTNMARMFDRCEHLTDLAVDNWNTSNVTNMSNMFRYGPDITLDLSNWDTSKVTSMECMFGYGHTIPVNISNWNTSNVTNMNTMFVYVPGLTTLDLGGWDTSKVTSMNRMFDNSSIKNLILGANWANNSSLKTLDLSSCGALTHDSALDVFNKLATRTNNPTLTLYSYTKKLLTEEEIAIATNKGWVVS